MSKAPTTEAPILVRKYGGSSLASVQRIKTVARDIRHARDEGFRLVVVVSAMGHTTDELTALARQAHPQPPRRELDMLLSVGERITMSLLSMALAEEGCPAISFTGSQCGIITDTSHSDARILEVKGDRVREALDQGHVVVVAGYQGVSLEREVTTLGRGGSDTTAVALADALGAVRCEILKDVDGVLSADPQLIPAATRHDQLTWDQMRAVATSGCGVVHLRAVEYAARCEVPLVVRSSFHEGPGTAIGTVPLTPPPTGQPTGEVTRPTPAKSGGPYRPLVLHIAEDVTHIRLTPAAPAVGRRWREILLARLDPALMVTEWLDSGKSWRWEGLTRQQDLADMIKEFKPDGDKQQVSWRSGISCLSLSGGSPDSWLEVQAQVDDLLRGQGCQEWRLRADSATLRILMPGPVTPDLAQELHRVLLQD